MPPAVHCKPPCHIRLAQQPTVMVRLDCQMLQSPWCCTPCRRLLPRLPGMCNITFREPVLHMQMQCNQLDILCIYRTYKSKQAISEETLRRLPFKHRSDGQIVPSAADTRKDPLAGSIRRYATQICYDGQTVRTSIMHVMLLQSLCKQFDTQAHELVSNRMSCQSNILRILA